MAEIAGMRAESVGDTAVAVPVSGSSATETLGRVRSLADAVRAAAIPGVTDVVAAPGRVTVAYDPLLVSDPAALGEAIAAAGRSTEQRTFGEPLVHELPVAYDGPDLAEVCAGHGISREDFVGAHTGPEYLVEAIGFLPGFGYLAGLPAKLATPRRATPRRLVPAGAVGIGGGQTGVYPFASPGGWNLVGRSDVRLFDVTRPRPALLAVGDRVRFVVAEVPPPVESLRTPPAAPTSRRAAITVIQPGLFTTIQDLGRPGHRAAGVPLSGAADSVSLRLANRLVGNRDGAAAIECTLLGPTLRFEHDCIVALVGGVFPGLASGAATRVPAGTEIPLGHATAGCRGYLAVAGGIDVDPVLGSRSTLVAAGFGGFAGRPLRSGDGLMVGEAEERPGGRKVTLPANGKPGVLRVIAGAQAEAFTAEAWSRTFRTSSRSDRMGMRLEGHELRGANLPAGAFAGMASVAVFPGTVQVPPDGQPIVLLADAQTIGGYPVLGQVIAADLPRAAQLRPGDEVRLEPVTLAEAHEALRHQEAAIRQVREAVQ